jgi:hypothetical protein
MYFTPLSPAETISYTRDGEQRHFRKQKFAYSDNEALPEGIAALSVANAEFIVPDESNYKPLETYKLSCASIRVDQKGRPNFSRVELLDL